MNDLKLLKKGVIWTVYDGKNVNVWWDNWIPRMSELKNSGKRNKSRLSGCVTSSSPTLGDGIWMWLDTFFYPHDVEVVLDLRAPNIVGDDFVAWHYENN